VVEQPRQARGVSSVVFQEPVVDRGLNGRANPELDRKRQTTVEPVFAQMKFNRRLDRFMRRGRAPCRSEWRLMAATHNLLKLYSRQTALAVA
jgi:hypothetical protein